MTQQPQQGEESTPPPAVPEQAPPTGAEQGDEVLDKHNRAILVGALCKQLANMGIRTGRKPSATAFIVRCAGGGLTQDVALCPDPDHAGRPGLYAWFWVWADGLRGEGPKTPEHMCPGEEIQTATARVARVLGVHPVGV